MKGREVYPDSFKRGGISAINGMVADDFDGDGDLDLLMNGNDYSTSVGIGRMMHLWPVVKRRQRRRIQTFP
jgi:hypothetical protein